MVASMKAFTVFNQSFDTSDGQINLRQSAMWPPGSHESRVSAGTSPVRVYQTCSWFGAGDGVIGVHSQVLSTPSATVGNQRSTKRVSSICALFLDNC